MNIKIYLVMALVIIMGATGCKKQEQPLKPQPSNTFTASFENGSGVFPATQSTTNIVITAGTNGWSLTPSVANTWCVPDKKYGAGDFKLRLTLSANTTGAERTVKIKLQSTNSNLPAVLLNITQQAN